MFYVAQAGDAIQIIDTAGAIDHTLTLPTGVTIDNTRRGRFAILSQQILFARASSINLWIDPSTSPFTVRPLSIRPPMAAPTLALGALTGLDGTFRVKVSFAVKDESGRLLCESPLGPKSSALTIANGSINMTNIPVSNEDHVNCRRIYRTTDEGAVYFNMLDIDDNETTTLDSAVADAALEILPADPELGNPSGATPGTFLDLLTVWRNRLWAKSMQLSEVDRILFTDLDKFYAWASGNFLLATPVGEDTFGIQGFLPRRDELVVPKRSRVLKVVGNDESDFATVIIAEGVGCIAPDSTVVVRDVGYWLGLDGVYRISEEGIECITRDKTDPWFLSDTYFNRSEFPNAIGGYNDVTDSYDLHLAATGSSVLDRWISYSIRRKQWTGPHLTNAFTPTARALLREESGEGRPTMGSAGGFLYEMNQAGASDDTVAIPIDWLTKAFSGEAPDIMHRWLQWSAHVKKQGALAGPIDVLQYVGDLDASASAVKSLPQNRDRTKMARPGAGRFLSLRFQHDTDAEDVELRGLEIPFVEAGRR